MKSKKQLGVLSRYPSSGVDNGTLEGMICNNLGPSTTGILIQPSITRVRWRLPSCISDPLVASGITRIEAYQISLIGWNSLPRSLESLVLSDFRFDDLQSMNWPEFFSHFPNLTHLTMAKGNLVGYVPSTIPSRMKEVLLNDNRLNGYFPDNIFGDFAGGFDFKFSIANNNIYGSISPPILLPLATATALSLNFSSNNFSGGLLSHLISPSFTGTLVLDLSHNQLTGTLPAGFALFPPQSLFASIFLQSNSLSGSLLSDLFSSSFTSSQSSTRSLYVAHNQLTGVIPDNIFSRNSSFLEPYPYPTVTLDASFNQLSGGISSGLFSLNFGAKSLTASFASNQLSGTVVNNFFGIAATGALWSSLRADFSSNGIEGALPPTLFYNCSSIDQTPPTQLSLNFAANRIAGAMPPSIFANCPAQQMSLNLSRNLIQAGLTEYALSILEPPPGDDAASPSIPWTTAAPPLAIELDLSHNLISGTLPPRLFTLSSSRTITLSLRNNSISGTFPSAIPFFANGNTSGLYAIYSLDLDHNQIQGNLSENFANLPSFVQSTLALTINHNNLDGPLPTSLCNNSVRYGSINLELKHNNLTGSISPSFLSSCNASAIAFLADDNQISGNLPAQLFTASSALLTWQMPNNLLTGWLSTPGLTNLSTIAYLNLSRNLISRIPDELVLASLRSHGSLNLSSNPLSIFSLPPGSVYNQFSSYDFSDCGLQGTLPNFLPNRCPTGIFAAKNRLTGSIPASWFSCAMNPIAPSNIYALRFIDIADNVDVSGTLPTQLLDSAMMAVLSARNTSLRGKMPSTNPWQSNLGLDLQRTQIDFCSNISGFGFRSPWTTYYDGYLVDCNLEHTVACQCPHLWPYCSATTCGNFNAGCNPNTQPAPDFICIDGLWTSNTSISSPTVTISPSLTTIVVNGNLTTSTIIFQNANATIVVAGCINVSTVVIELTPEQIKGLKSGKIQRLLSTTSTDPSCGNFSAVNVLTKVKGRTCRKLMARKAGNSLTNLDVAFSVDLSSCNVWWIALVSVAGFLLIAGGVIAILLYLHFKARRSPLKASAD